jgi:HEAT repeat protein
LIKVLESGDSEAAWRAGRALGAIGSDAAAAVEPLRKALQSNDPKVRAYAAFALGRVGSPALAATDQLIENAFDADPVVRRSSIRALQQIDPPVEKTLPLVIRILERGDMSVIMPALNSLAAEGERAVPRLKQALRHEQARYWASLALAEIGPAAAAAVPDLQAVLVEEKDPDTRLQILVALGEVGKPAESAIPTILDVLGKEEFSNVKYAAVFALGQIGGTDASRVELRKLLESDDEFLRTISAWALARNNPSDKQLVDRAVELIVSAFKSDDVNVRRAAARVAVEFDVDSSVVAPVLVEALQDQDDTVVANAIAALATLGPKVLAHIDQALQNEQLRHYAVRLVARLGHEGAAAVPALVRVIQQSGDSAEDQEFVREAQFALSAIGPGASDAIPVLMKSLSSTNEEVSASACFALGKMGPAAIGAVPQLRSLMGSESTLVRLASLRALLEIQPGQRQLAAIAAPMLIKALTNEQELVRAEAASALGDMGNLATRAIPDLQKLLDDESETVREAAAEAIKKLGG